MIALVCLLLLAAPSDRLVMEHDLTSDRDLRPFMAARSHDVTPAGLIVRCDFGEHDSVVIRWDVPPMKADRVVTRVRMPASAGAWRMRVAFAATGDNSFILPTIQAKPDDVGWFTYDFRMDDPGLEVRKSGPADPNLVVPRPGGDGPAPIFTSVNVQLYPADGSPLRSGRGVVQMSRLELYRDTTAESR